MSNYIQKTARTSLLAAGLLAVSLPLCADYEIQVISASGAPYTEAFGITDKGLVSGSGYDDFGLLFSFVYDIQTGEFTEVSSDMGVVQLTDKGEMVGSIGDACAFRDKKGNVTTFNSPPDAVDATCSGRGMNQLGVLTGFAVDEFGVWTGFIHDPKSGQHAEFLPSSQTIAHGIDQYGNVVGSVTLEPGEAYPGSAGGRYGFRRDKAGSVKFFEITQSLPGETRGRGISNTGLITGFYRGADAFGLLRSFVTRLSRGETFDSITLGEDEMLYQSPCNADMPTPAGTLVLTDMSASHINKDGVVAGSCVDYYLDENTFELVDGHAYGFIATPVCTHPNDNC